MPACHALTKTGHPCRGYGVHVVNEVGSEGYLCHRHTHYFDPSRPDQHLAQLVSPYLYTEQSNWLLQMLKSPLYRREDRARVMSYLAPYMPANAVRDERAQAIGNKMYKFYVEAEILAPMAVLEFWRRNVRNNMHVLCYSCKWTRTPEGGTEVVFGSMLNAGIYTRMTERLFGPFVKGLPASIVLTYLLTWMRNPFMTTNPPTPLSERYREVTKAIWLRAVDDILPLTANRHLVGMSLKGVMKSIEERHENYLESLWWYPGVKEHVEAALRRSQEAGRAAQRQRMEGLREELMAAAWAPARVERWVEAGIEFDDC
jgi:hypothetical protein